MARLFRKHYTREQARALLPQIRQWLNAVAGLRQQLEKHNRRLASLLRCGGDVGGKVANQWVRTLVAIKTTLREFQTREIQIKDLDRGLIDFPALLGDKEVFLCWEQGEEDIEFWHELHTGYAGRERL